MMAGAACVAPCVGTLHANPARPPAPSPPRRSLPTTLRCIPSCTLTAEQHSHAAAPGVLPPVPAARPGASGEAGAGASLRCLPGVRLGPGLAMPSRGCRLALAPPLAARVHASNRCAPLLRYRRYRRSTRTRLPATWQRRAGASWWRPQVGAALGAAGTACRQRCAGERLGVCPAQSHGARLTPALPAPAPPSSRPQLSPPRCPPPHRRQADAAARGAAAPAGGRAPRAHLLAVRRHAGHSGGTFPVHHSTVRTSQYKLAPACHTLARLHLIQTSLHPTLPHPLQDFLHDFQDSTGLLPRAQEDDGAPAATATASGDGDATTAEEGGDGEASAGQQRKEGEEGDEEEDEEEVLTRGRRGSVVRCRSGCFGGAAAWHRMHRMRRPEPGSRLGALRAAPVHARTHTGSHLPSCPPTHPPT